MEELCRYIPHIDNDDDDDDDGYDTPAATESWDDACNDYASFLEHRQKWAAVMTELGMFRRRALVEMEMLLGCNAQGEPRQRPTNDYASFLEHNKIWAVVMMELGMFRRRAVVEMEMLLGCNAQGEPLQRPTQLIDRRGKSLPRLNFD